MQAVPLGFFLFLVELAAGGLIVTALLDWDGEVSGGYLFLNGIFVLVLGAAGVWLRTTLPAERLVPYAAGRAALGLEPVVWAVFTALGAAQLLLIRSDRRRAGRVAGVLVALAALAALGVSGAAYAPQAGAPRLLAALLLGALALGTVWSGMMLGHWYLVTPLLAPRPLLRLNAGMAATLAALGALALTSLNAATWMSWLRLGVGIAAPLAVALPVWRTARVRSMMSATGLLYVALGLVLAGEIIAKSLFFLTGTPS